jgi:hypothetical protein
MTDIANANPNQNFEEKPEDIPEEKSSKLHKHLRHRNILIITIIIVVLLAISVSGTKKPKDSIEPPATTPVAAVENNNAVAQQTKQPTLVSEKTYNDIIWKHLAKIGDLSRPMNISCSAKFPPPEPCASNIKTYRVELLNTKAEMDSIIAQHGQAGADLNRAGSQLLQKL